MRCVTLVLAVAALLVMGCGGARHDTATTISPSVAQAVPEPDTGPPATPATVAALLDHVPGATYRMAVMDLATAKRQLGVHADHDPGDYRRNSDRPDFERFDSAALAPLNYLVNRVPALGAIDAGRVTAGVSADSLFAGDAAILATTQSRDAIERGLRKAGARVLAPHTFGLAARFTGQPRVVIAGSGLIVLGSSQGVAERAMASTTSNPRVAGTRALLESVHGMLRAVRRMTTREHDAPCVTAIAGAQRFDAHRSEELVLTLDEPADADRVVLGRGAALRDVLSKDYRVRGVTADGRTLRIEVGLAADALSNASAATIVVHNLELNRVYRCKDATPRPLFKAPAEPDTSGTDFEDGISDSLAKSATGPIAVRVRCGPEQKRDHVVVHCTGTRKHPGGVYHYTITVDVGANNSAILIIHSIKLRSPDDKTGAADVRR